MISPIDAEWRLKKRELKKRHKSGNWERNAEGKRGREGRLAGQRGRRGSRDQAERRERTGSGGNNDMKEPSWRSHTALAHLRRHKISWPLHIDTTHTTTNTLTCRCTKKVTHRHTRARSQRLDNKEKSVMSRTSKHNCHHSSAYTNWPLLPLQTAKHNELQTRAPNAPTCYFALTV